MASPTAAEPQQKQHGQRGEWDIRPAEATSTILTSLFFLPFSSLRPLSLALTARLTLHLYIPCMASPTAAEPQQKQQQHGQPGVPRPLLPRRTSFPSTTVSLDVNANTSSSHEANLLDKNLVARGRLLKTRIQQTIKFHSLISAFTTYQIFQLLQRTSPSSTPSQTRATPSSGR